MREATITIYYRTKNISGDQMKIKIDYVKSAIIDDLVYKANISRKIAERVFEAIVREEIEHVRVIEKEGEK